MNKSSSNQDKAESISTDDGLRKKQSIIKSRAKVDKGTWRMPRLSQAKKDVISCEKLRVDANNP